jgi:hypothetical protein
LKAALETQAARNSAARLFQHFSDQVIGRIRAGRGPRGRRFKASVRVSAVARMVCSAIFEARPGVIGGLATSLCLLLVIGVVWADRSDSAG